MSDSTVGQSFSDRTFQLCTASDSVSSLLAADPALAPGEAWHKLFGHHVGKPKSSHAADDAGKGPVSKEALERAAKCGKWGPTQPSDLFLRVRPLPKDLPLSSPELRPGSLHSVSACSV